MPMERRRVFFKTLIFGVISAYLYFLLYFFNEDILAHSKEGGWNFILPILIAFTFSIVHGNFTGHFWDLFGIKAKTTKK